MNAGKLQQDHPCVIDVIRRFYLHHPVSKDVPLQLENPDEIEPSAGQARAILKHLNFKVKVPLKKTIKIQFRVYLHTTYEVMMCLFF